jgi:hypothetical protein
MKLDVRDFGPFVISNFSAVVSWLDPTKGNVTTWLQIGLTLPPDITPIVHSSAKFCFFRPLTPEFNPSAQRCVTRFFTGDFAS